MKTHEQLLIIYYETLERSDITEKAKFSMLDAIRDLILLEMKG